MTVGGTVLKAFVLFAVTCIFAVIGWDHAARVIKATSGPSWLLGYFVLIALSFLAIANPRIAPIGGLVYAVLMGLWVGGISQVYEVAYDGIVAQALMATMAIVLVCLLLYAFGLVKVTRRFVLVVVAATLGIGLLYLTAWILSIFGVNLRFWTRSDPDGIAISVVICIVAALNLFIDFAFVDQGVQGSRPRVHGVVLGLGAAGDGRVALPRGAVPAGPAPARVIRGRPVGARSADGLPSRR